MSNLTTTVTAEEAAASSNDVVNMFMTVEQTIVSALGMATNLIIMFTMPFAAMNKRIKLILTALAFADFGAVVNNGLISVALTSIVPVLTGQDFIIASINLSACQSTKFLADFFEASVQWVTACLTAERFYVVYFPFKAKQLTFKTSVFVICGAFLVCFAATSPHFAYYTITAIGDACVPANTDEMTSMTYFAFRHLVFEHVIPPLMILVFNALVLLHLARRAQSSKHLSSGVNKNGGEKSKVKITITLVIVSTLHVCGFIPCGIICYIWYSMSNTNMAAMAYQNVVITYAAYGILHCVNFVIYVTTMDAYRHVLANPPICTYKAKKSK